MYRLLLLLLSLLFANGAFAQTLSAEEDARLGWVLQRGRLLFEIDRAAWVTTDDLRARVPDLGTAGFRGWTVERSGTGYDVAFYIGEGDARVVGYQARVEDNRVVRSTLVPEGSRPPLTPAQRRLADARAAVARMGVRPCTNARFNTAIIPPEQPEGDIDVYALTPQTENGVYPFGGHFLATIGPAGEIRSQRGFMRACYNAAIPAGDRTEAMIITHLLDRTPTEIHVFLARWIGMPIYVSTNTPDRVWRVDSDRIMLVTPTPAQGTSRR